MLACSCLRGEAYIPIMETEQKVKTSPVANISM